MKKTLYFYPLPKMEPHPNSPSEIAQTTAGPAISEGCLGAQDAQPKLDHRRMTGVYKKITLDSLPKNERTQPSKKAVAFIPDQASMFVYF